ncbi:uncharacterized protein LOC134483581 isoform X2 [Rattus norvegicus]|uniref:uncharacterized protein LOC134483581 isoform X2 n=1 Tax=Rattus norvegicus TaxID=10116 RepID=UPI002FD7D3D0
MFSCLRGHFGRGNIDCGETRVKGSSLSSQSNDGQRQHFWGMCNAGRETSSPGTALSEKQAKKEKERLIKELQLITKERNDLRDRLRFLTERSMKNRNLLSQLLMENTCRKKLVPLKQESKEVHLDCALNQKYLVDFNKKDKDQQRPDPASGLRKCKRAGIGHTPVRELPEE